MTWLEWMRKIKPDISPSECDDILMCETAYPFSDLKFTMKQARKVLKRMIKNGK